MIVDVYASRDRGHFTLVRFARDPDGLSVTHGRFLTLAWTQFQTRGLDAVRQAIVEYAAAQKTGPSQFDQMSRDERISFFAMHVAFQVAHRDTDLWWIDLLRPIGDGSIPGPLGPPYRIQFRPSEGSSRFYDALMRLMLLDEAYSEN